MLPKFTTIYGKKLNGALTALGMGIAFSLGADFSRTSGDSNSLCISDVEHKTWLAVDEQGTEAAAAGSVTDRAALALMLPPNRFQMSVDHPFFCAIAEQSTGAILFAGIVSNPARQ